jgi:hypothetical protein
MEKLEEVRKKIVAKKNNFDEFVKDLREALKGAEANRDKDSFNNFMNLLTKICTDHSNGQLGNDTKYFIKKLKESQMFFVAIRSIEHLIIVLEARTNEMEWTLDLLE